MKSCMILLSIFCTYLSADISCRRPCPMTYMPVCGSNGVTYRNRCAMTVAECELQTTISVSTSGPCVQSPEVLTDPECLYSCTIQLGCFVSCTMQFDPVCGTDGKTYANWCNLLSMSCMFQTGVTLLRSGPCSDPVG